MRCQPVRRLDRAPAPFLYATACCRPGSRRSPAWSGSATRPGASTSCAGRRRSRSATCASHGSPAKPPPWFRHRRRGRGYSATSWSSRRSADGWSDAVAARPTVDFAFTFRDLPKAGFFRVKWPPRRLVACGAPVSAWSGLPAPRELCAAHSAASAIQPRAYGCAQRRSLPPGPVAAISGCSRQVERPTPTLPATRTRCALADGGRSRCIARRAPPTRVREHQRSPGCEAGEPISGTGVHGCLPAGLAECELLVTSAHTTCAPISPGPFRSSRFVKAAHQRMEHVASSSPRTFQRPSGIRRPSVLSLQDACVPIAGRAGRIN